MLERANHDAVAHRVSSNSRLGRSYRSSRLFRWYQSPRLLRSPRQNRIAALCNRRMVTLLTRNAIVAAWERGVTCKGVFSASPLSRTCPNGGTGGRTPFARVRRQRRVGSNPASATPSYNAIDSATVARYDSHTYQVYACQYRQATNPARPTRPRGLCFCERLGLPIRTSMLDTIRIELGSALTLSESEAMSAWRLTNRVVLRPFKTNAAAGRRMPFYHRAAGAPPLPSSPSAPTVVGQSAQT
jgi:hypothetical protein